jgi:Txe/YoeB family toxin of Txe-Axe toxin-antitoxin module
MTPHDKVVEMCGDFEVKSKEDLAIRAERQRERANKWMERCATLERQLFEQKNDSELRIAKLVDEIRKMNTEFNKNIDVLKKDSFEDHQKIRQLNGEKIDAYSRGHNEGREYAEKQYAREIRIGRRELARQRKERIGDKINALMWYSVAGLDDNDELLGWVRRAIKRRIGAPSHVEVVILEGSKKRENSPPRLIGSPGYHTTPSGKTIVTHPGAYGWRTVYHCSTERVEVGREWIRKNIYYLAQSEAEMRVK